MSSRVGTSYNVREKWKKCRHEFLEMRKWDPDHKGKGLPQEQKVYLLKQKESKALGTDTSRLIDEVVGECGNYLLGFSYLPSEIKN